MSWTNNDGLTIYFGTENAQPAHVGVVCAGEGTEKEYVAVLEPATMDLTGGLIGGRANAMIPNGSFIESATLHVTETFVGATGTLDLGTINADGTYTNLDEDGIDVAIAVASLTAGTTIACDGAQVGTTVGADAYLSYDIDTVDFTAGKAFLVVKVRQQPYADQDEE